MRGYVTGDGFFRLATEQAVHWLAQRPAHQVPKRQVYTTDCHGRYPAKPVWHCGSVHLIPEQLYVEGILANQEFAKVLLDYGAGEVAATIVDGTPGDALVGENFDGIGILPRSHP